MKRKFINSILYEDQDFLVVNKPPVLSSPHLKKSSNDIREEGERYSPSIIPCHKMGSDISGISLFAKNQKAYCSSQRQFRQQIAKKIYHAVVEGIHSFKNTLVQEPIYIRDSGRAAIHPKKGRPSATELTTLTHFWKHTLISCHPFTNGLHQIRLHSATQKAPLVGDTLYGGGHCYLSHIKKDYRLGREEKERPLIQRIALHAYKIIFQGFSKKLIQVEAPYPKDFKALIFQLNKNNICPCA